MSSNGKDAPRSIKNLPLKTYFKAIFKPDFISFPALFTYEVQNMMIMSKKKRTSIEYSKTSRPTDSVKEDP